MKNTVRRVVKWTIIFLLLLALAYIIFFLSTSCATVYVEVPIRKDIHDAIRVEGLENKFIHIQSVSFGGAGAGGLGAPIIHTSSPQQFASLVPFSEPVYSAFTYGEYLGRKSVFSCGVVYWAFIENRAGLVQYQDMYDGEQISPGTRMYCYSFNGNSITFKYGSDYVGTIEDIEHDADIRGFKTRRETGVNN